CSGASTEIGSHFQPAATNPRGGVVGNEFNWAAVNFMHCAGATPVRDQNRLIIRYAGWQNCDPTMGLFCPNGQVCDRAAGCCVTAMSPVPAAGVNIYRYKFANCPGAAANQRAQTFCSADANIPTDFNQNGNWFTDINITNQTMAPRVLSIPRPQSGRFDN